MSISVSFRGQNYIIPELGDTYTQGTVDYLNALSTGAVPFPSTADVDIGASGFGLKGAYFKTRAANPSASGLLRLANGDTVAWRNVGNTADLSLAVDAQNQLTFGGVEITGNPLLGANTAAAQSIPNAAYTPVVFGTVEVDTDSAYNSGTGVFTVPAGKGGHYEITASICWAIANANSATISIFKGAVIQKEFQLINFGAAASEPITAILSLAALDTISVRAWQNSGGARVLEATAAHNFVSIKRIPA